MNYTKPFLSLEQQIELLDARGLSIKNHEGALQALSDIGYYRLSAYWYSFRLNDNGHILDRFIQGSALEDAIFLYEFDRRLRKLVFAAIEQLEIKIKAALVRYLANRYGPFSHEERSVFKPSFNYDDWHKRLRKETERAASGTEFLRHYRETYEDFPKLPIWMAAEIISFGSMSRLLDGILFEKDSSSKVSWGMFKEWNVPPVVGCSWIKSLTIVRNICAHHGRLWNRRLVIHSPLIPKPRNTPEWPQGLDSKKIYFTLCILRQILWKTPFYPEWAKQVVALINCLERNPHFLTAMGIPENWSQEDFLKISGRMLEQK